MLNEVVANLLPTPTLQAAKHGELSPIKREGNRPQDNGNLWVVMPRLAEEALLPTPAVNDMGRGKTVEDWDAWTDKMRAAHGNGNGHGKSLEIEAQRLLPTPNAADGKRNNLNHQRGEGNPTLLGAVSIGATTAPPSPDGNTSSDDPHQHQLSLDELATPA
jgi:DNA (cytosine-5)-methyltransferase 1